MPTPFGDPQSELASDHVTESLVAALANLLLLASGAFILFATLFPFDLFFEDSGSLHQILSRVDLRVVTDDRLIWKDMVENVLFFMPFGFAAAALFGRHFRRWWATLLLATLLGSALSFCIETLQLFMPLRDCALSDWLTNSAGSLLGAVVFLLMGGWSLRLIVRPLAAKWRWVTPTTVRVAGAIIIVLACLVPWPFTMAMHLRAWPSNFPLMLGSEHTGQKPWNGRVAQLHISNHAMDEHDVAYLFGGGDPLKVFGSSACASYDLREGPPYRDHTGQLPPFEWKWLPPDLPVVRGDSVPVGDGRWLETTGPVELLVKKIRATSEFTLFLEFSTPQVHQPDRAFIASISDGLYARDITLAQGDDDLVLRLRMRLSHGNGTAPEIILPDLFRETGPHKIALTYTTTGITLYVDGVQRRYEVPFTPEMSFVWYLFPLDGWSMQLGGHTPMKCEAIFALLVFVPLGILAAGLSLTERRIGRDAIVHHALYVFGPVIAIELGLSMIGSRWPNPKILLIDAVVAAGTFVGATWWMLRHAKPASPKITPRRRPPIMTVSIRGT